MRTVQRLRALPGISGSFLMVDDGGPRVRPYRRASLSHPADGEWQNRQSSSRPLLPLPGSDLSIRRVTGVNVWATVIEQVTPRRTMKKVRSASVPGDHGARRGQSLGSV